jgi:phosphoglycolate phosphatase-like HAD superfamily hydrolase
LDQLLKDVVRQKPINIDVVLNGLPQPKTVKAWRERRAIQNAITIEFARQEKKTSRHGIPSDLQRPEKTALPFPDVQLSLKPGALDKLNEIRKPENEVVLISSKGAEYARAVVNKLGLSHYFDRVQGVAKTL